MSDWQPIETAEKTLPLMLFGFLDPHPDSRELYGHLDRPTRAVGYWDEIDEAWCVTGSTWVGPWFKPTHWQPLPEPPKETA